MEPNLNSIESIPQQTFESLDVLKEKYRRRLDSILYRRLTVENICSFADDALEDVAKLTEEVLEEYKNNPVFEDVVGLDDRAREDLTFNKLDLPDLQGGSSIYY